MSSWNQKWTLTIPIRVDTNFILCLDLKGRLTENMYQPPVTSAGRTLERDMHTSG
jgi:hypothetical protein